MHLVCRFMSSINSSIRVASRLKSAYSRTAQERQKSGYDKKVRGAILQPGDRVLVRRVAFDGKHKIADKWEEDPYLVVSQPNNDIPVYVVQRENGEGKKRTLHRNLLLPIGFLPSDEEKRKDPAPVARRKVRQPTRKEPTKSESIEQIDETESDEESEQDYYVIVSEMSPQSNSDNDATSVEVDQTTGTLNATGDGHASVEGGQGSGFGGDALPCS
ncbi:Hypothetical predicted protein [Mytilus galloprovincialis]|uniref:Uncharacterized protein n=1 Tax=Mytilus galloprovincialis TaxID=29158 RepID=A0A8B6GQT2_MYTGA|nr:Hypothetical predicted protein [Mytilus galloprovincialis]